MRGSTGRTIQLRITGRVHNVGFREYLQRSATRLGVSGWVRNGADGSVEALAEGSADKVERFIADCRVGPGVVEAIDVQDAPYPQAPGAHFAVLASS